MRSIIHKGLTLALVLVLGVFRVSGARTDPAPACQEAKIQAASKRAQCLAQAKKDELRGGVSNTRRDCETKFNQDIAGAGTACRYVDNGDGTVSDLDTLLIWEKKTTDGSAHDVRNVYSWSATPGGMAPDGSAFSQFLGALNNCTSDGGSDVPAFAGHCDWRLPRVEELRTIVDLGADGCNRFVQPCINPIFGPTRVIAYWTSTSTATFVEGAGNDSAWSVNFLRGNTDSMTAKFITFAVRGVRGGR
jgi:hypothetical protein